MEAGTSSTEVVDELFDSQDMAPNIPDDQSSNRVLSSNGGPSSGSVPSSSLDDPNFNIEPPPLGPEYDVIEIPPLPGGDEENLDADDNGDKEGPEMQIDEEIDSEEEIGGRVQHGRRRRLLTSSEDESEEENDGLEEPKRKLKAPSPVWECGAIKVLDGAKCQVCGRIFKTGVSQSTSNISRHILKAHKTTWEGKKLAELTRIKKEEKLKKEKEKAKKKAETKPLKQTSLENFVRKSSPLDPLKKKKIDRAILKYIVVEKEPFDLVEKSAFREVIFKCEPSYTCQSHTTVRRHFDSFAGEVKDALKKEINEDLDVPDKVVTLTSDHGSSNDKFRTRKNVVTLSRCTKNFELKTDTIGVINCDGTQSGDVIRKDVKVELDKVGRDDTWHVNWVTDGERKQINARAPGKHPQVGLETCHTATCIDHTAHLAVEESLDSCISIKESVDKAHKVVTSMKDSIVMREAFLQQMILAGDEPLSAIKGTPHRWFFKWAECNRVLVLRKHIERFQEEFENYPPDAVMEPEDWRNLLIYVNSLKTLVNASVIFEGQNYPTGSSVIPFLDQINADLAVLVNQLPGDDKAFPRKLLWNLKSERRFPNCYKEIVPFNCLTLLDPRYMDIYFTEDESTKAIEDICKDVVYISAEDDTVAVSPPPVSVQLTANSFALRRAQLIASKQLPQPSIGRTPATLKQKINEEKERFLSLRGTVDLTANPQIWWREHSKEFPLLAKFYRAHSSFPATSTASERVFNVEGLIVTKYRKNLDPKRASDLVVAKDFLKKRENGDSFRLCQECLRNPPSTHTYVINCPSHNA